MNSGLRIIEGDESCSLSLFRSLLEGERKIDQGFRERFIDGVAGFLNEPLWKKFETQLIVPFDQLTELVWRIKKIRERDYVFAPGEERNVEQVKMRSSARHFLEKSFLSHFNLDVNNATESEMVEVAGKILKELDNSLKNLLFVYHGEVSGEEVTAQLLLSDYSLLTMISLKLWTEVGYLLEALAWRLDGLKKSLYLLGSPVKANQQLVEADYLSLLRACGILKEAVARLDREENPATEKVLLDMLNSCKVYPQYFRQIIDGEKELVGVLDEDPEKNDLVSAKVFGEKTLELKSNCLTDFYEKNRPVPGANVLRQERQEDRDLEITGDHPGSLIAEKILMTIKALTDEGRINEAELLVRSFQVVENQVNFQEYMDMEENYLEWMRQEVYTALMLRLMNRRRFRIT